MNQKRKKIIHKNKNKSNSINLAHKTMMREIKKNVLVAQTSIWFKQIMIKIKLKNQNN